MRKGIGIFGVLFYSVALIVAYHYALKHFDGNHFRFFNYQILITKCGPVVYDRIIKIEMKQGKKK